jgi:nucleoside-diphosphate-sugar epimerase
MERRNIESSLSLFYKVKKIGCENFIFFSSMAAFEGAKSNYGRAKKKIEDSLLPNGAISIRPGLVYGVNSGLVATLRRQIINNKLIPLIDGGKQKIYPISVQNLCLGVLAIIEEPDRFKIKPVVLAAKHPTTLHDFCLALARQSQKTPCFFSIPSVLVFFGLRVIEIFGVNIPFKSDSVVSLCNQCLDPFTGNLSLSIEPEGELYEI